MTQRSETFYEGKTAPMIEAELGAQIGVAGPSIQRYKAGYIPPESRPVHILATAGVQRGFLARAWLMRFLQAARYPAPEVLLTQLAETPHGAAPALPGAFPRIRAPRSPGVWQAQSTGHSMPRRRPVRRAWCSPSDSAAWSDAPRPWDSSAGSHTAMGTMWRPGVRSRRSPPWQP